MDRVFLDANVLFSAAYRPGSRLNAFWALTDVTLVTSTYALDEARVNLQELPQRQRLDALVADMEVVTSWDTPIPEDVVLRAKDVPILKAAISSEATHLVTGDKRDFGPYAGKVVGGVLILPPGEYLARRD